MVRKKDTERFKLGSQKGTSKEQTDQIIDYFDEASEELEDFFYIEWEEVIDDKTEIKVTDTPKASVEGNKVTVSNPESYNKVVRSYDSDWVSHRWNEEKPVPFHQVYEELGHLIGSQLSENGRFGMSPNRAKQLSNNEVKSELIRLKAKDELNGTLALSLVGKEMIKEDIEYLEVKLDDLEDQYSENQTDYLEKVSDSLKNYRERFDDIDELIEAVGSAINNAPGDSKYGNKGFSKRFIEWNLLNDELSDGIEGIEDRVERFSNYDRKRIESERRVYHTEEGMMPVAYLAGRRAGLDIVEDKVDLTPKYAIRADADELGGFLDDYSDDALESYGMET